MQGAVVGLVFFSIVLVVFAIVVVAKTVKVIPQAEAAVIERMGSYSRTVSGQLTLLMPFLERIRARVDLRERVVSFPPQPVITEDNLTLNIDTVGRPTAARSVCNNETVPASWTSGHGSPVWPAATASYAVTDCFGAQRDSASKTSSGAALPASQALAHRDSETLGHHMISECSCLVAQRPITRILTACPSR